MKNKFILLSIIIPAYNEGKNIKNILKSVLLQRMKKYKIKEILILSDGSTDDTIQQAMKVKNKKIKIFDHKDRRGKAVRLNEAFNMASGEIFILLDADTIINLEDTLSNLLKPFEGNKNLVMTGGNPYPLEGRTFIERAVNLTYYAYYPLRSLRGGFNPHGCDGKILAISKRFAKTLSIPKNMIGVDSYLYLTCIQKGYAFKHVPLATVFYRSPSSVKDHLKQNIRFMSAEKLHEKIFGEMFKKEYFVPKKIMYSLYLRQLIKKPAHALFIYVLNSYCRYVAKKKFQEIGSKWDLVTSTKKGISL